MAVNGTTEVKTLVNSYSLLYIDRHLLYICCMKCVEEERVDKGIRKVKKSKETIGQLKQEKRRTKKAKQREKS